MFYLHVWFLSLGYLHPNKRKTQLQTLCSKQNKEYQENVLFHDDGQAMLKVSDVVLTSSINIKFWELKNVALKCMVSKVRLFSSNKEELNFKKS